MNDNLLETAYNRIGDDLSQSTDYLYLVKTKSVTAIFEGQDGSVIVPEAASVELICDRDEYLKYCESKVVKESPPEDKALKLLMKMLKDYEVTNIFTYQEFNAMLKELGSDHRVGQYTDPVSAMTYAQGLFIQRRMKEV